MERESPATVKNAKMPKHITKIGMTHEQYYGLKVYLKSAAVPGTPAFERKHRNKESMQIYRQWLNDALEEIGPRFFPGGGKGLAWPEDHNAIYEAVHQVVRTVLIGIRNHCKRRELRAVPKEEGNNEMEMAQNDGHYKVKDADNAEDAEIKEDKYAQWEQVEAERMIAFMMAVEEEYQTEDTMDGMDAEPMEVEDLLGLMKPEVFARLPNLEDEYFDWDEMMDPSSPEPIARLLLLLS